MKSIKNDFPLLREIKENGNPICYLDNASTTQKPQRVIDAITNFYTHHNANVGRGVYRLAEHATQLYENARGAVAQFIGANPHEIVFTTNATQGINMVAHMLSARLKRGDEILISELEHHANLLPWQRVAQQTGAVLKFIPVRADGSLDVSSISKLVSKKTKLLAITQSSNALGTYIDVAPIIKMAHDVGALALVDACQTVPHERVEAKKMGADFLVFSGHKMLGPTGIGVLYVSERMHDFEPVQRGGGIVFEADWFDASWVKAPHKFEAGTPPIAQAIGLHAAIDYLNASPIFKELVAHEARLCSRLIDGLSSIQGITVLGPVEQLKKRGHMVGFTVDGIHSHDVAAYLDRFGICVRAGHFCAQPLAKKLGYESAVRASFYLYNDEADVDRLIKALERIDELR